MIPILIWDEAGRSITLPVSSNPPSTVKCGVSWSAERAALPAHKDCVLTKSYPALSKDPWSSAVRTGSGLSGGYCDC